MTKSHISPYEEFVNNKIGGYPNYSTFRFIRNSRKGPTRSSFRFQLIPSEDLLRYDHRSVLYRYIILAGGLVISGEQIPNVSNVLRILNEEYFLSDENKDMYLPPDTYSSAFIYQSMINEKQGLPLPEPGTFLLTPSAYAPYNAMKILLQETNWSNLVPLDDPPKRYSGQQTIQMLKKVRENNQMQGAAQLASIGVAEELENVSPSSENRSRVVPEAVVVALENQIPSSQNRPHVESKAVIVEPENESLSSQNRRRVVPNSVVVVPENERSSSEKRSRLAPSSVVVVPENESLSSQNRRHIVPNLVVVVPEYERSSSERRPCLAPSSVVVVPENERSSSEKPSHLAPSSVVVVPENESLSSQNRRRVVPNSVVVVSENERSSSEKRPRLAPSSVVVVPENESLSSQNRRRVVPNSVVDVVVVPENERSSSEKRPRLAPNSVVVVPENEIPSTEKRPRLVPKAIAGPSTSKRDITLTRAPKNADDHDDEEGWVKCQDGSDLASVTSETSVDEELDQKPHRKPLWARYFTLEEGQKLLDTICKHDLFLYTEGVKLWQLFEQKKVLKNRTHHSMKNHYKKVILPKILAGKRYKITPEKLEGLKKAMRKMKSSRHCNICPEINLSPNNSP